MLIPVHDGELYATASGSGPPLLLIHGWPLSHRIFDYQVAPLSAHLTVVVYDRRGFGRSRAPAGLARELDDIDRVLDAMKLETAHILGMSQGGRLALRFAAVRRQRFRSMILQSPAIDGFVPDEVLDDRVPLTDFADLAAAGRIDELRQSILALPLMHIDPHETAAVRLFEAIVDGYTAADLVPDGPGVADFDVDVLAAMRRFRKPTLLLTGGRETAGRKRCAAELLKCIPDSREVVLPSGGHLCNLTEPEGYNRAVLEFIAALEPIRT